MTTGPGRAAIAVERGGERPVEDRVRPGRVVAHHGAQPERQAVDQDGFGGLRLGQRGDEVAADLDGRPVVGSLAAMARDPVVHLGVARPGRRQEPGPAVAGQPPGRRQPEPALAAARPAEGEDQRAATSPPSRPATAATTAANRARPSRRGRPRRPAAARGRGTSPIAERRRRHRPRSPHRSDDRPGQHPADDRHEPAETDGADAIDGRRHARRTRRPARPGRPRRLAAARRRPAARARRRRPRRTPAPATTGPLPPGRTARLASAATWIARTTTRATTPPDPMAGSLRAISACAASRASSASVVSARPSRWTAPLATAIAPTARTAARVGTGSPRTTITRPPTAPRPRAPTRPYAAAPVASRDELRTGIRVSIPNAAAISPTRPRGGPHPTGTGRWTSAGSTPNTPRMASARAPSPAARRQRCGRRP